MRFQTLSDLASTGELEGRCVRLLEDVGSFVAKGTVGTVMSVRSDEPRATVHYVMIRCGGRERAQDVESPFSLLELWP
jgi:hypothetical protein